MLWLPGARIVDFGTDGGTWTDRTDPKGCLHTTEGGSWPRYDDGKKAPHLTVLPIPGKGIEKHQHVSFAHAARALRNPPGGVQTNRDHVFQIELIGTCVKGGPGYYWPDADDVVLAALYHEVIHPISAAFAIPELAPPWQAYPASYGARGRTNTVRMSGSQFDHYSGWLGHQHVPENDHGDPGAFPWSRMIATASTAPQEDDDMLSKEAQDWIEARMDAHDAYVLANLKATIGRQVTAQSAQLAATTTALQQAQDGAVDMVAVQAAAQAAADKAVDGLVERLGDAKGAAQ